MSPVMYKILAIIFLVTMCVKDVIATRDLKNNVNS